MSLLLYLTRVLRSRARSVARAVVVEVFLTPDLATPVGGILHLAYSFGAEVHPIRLAVALFSTTPSGVNNDYTYISPPTGGESGIIATFQAIGALWAPYYPPGWSLNIAAVWRNVGGFAQPLPVVPTSSPIAGIYSGPTTPEAVGTRILRFWSQGGQRWRTYLQQLPVVSVGQFAVDVSSISGGIDSRDRRWYTYWASGHSAIVGRDGTPFQPGGTVSQRFGRTLAGDPAIPGSPYLVSG